ncbi:hypothetical protein [Bdellovibrio bacteriovorus]|uniref:hypothetical protein n=1 Tax=Bdellovibrio TaxID=958 RepID=UPI0035A98704
MFNLGKKLGVMTLALCIGSQALALSMECTVGATTATNSGLMPIENDITLNTTEVQRNGSLDLKKCSTTEALGMTLSFCATDDMEAIGIYKANVTILEKNNEAYFSTAQELLATPKKGRSLISLLSISTLTPQFMQKMDQAEISYPEYKGGDSLMIDDAVAAAFRKNVLNKSDVVNVSIGTCTLK